MLSPEPQKTIKAHVSVSHSKTIRLSISLAHPDPHSQRAHAALNPLGAGGRPATSRPYPLSSTRSTAQRLLTVASLVLCPQLCVTYCRPTNFKALSPHNISPCPHSTLTACPL